MAQLNLLVQLHKDNDYGITSPMYAPLVKLLADQYDVKSISDYGAGKCCLQKILAELGCSDMEYYPFDPAFPNYGPPKLADLVCCINVLEHVEPPYLTAVLQDLRRIVKTVCFVTIQFGPALKTFPNGQNTHLIQKPVSWWIPHICAHFEVVELDSTEKGFWAVLEPRLKS